MSLMSCPLVPNLPNKEKKAALHSRIWPSLAAFPLTLLPKDCHQLHNKPPWVSPSLAPSGSVCPLFS